MNLFDSHDADDCLGPESQPSGHAIEALLRGRGLPAPAAGFRHSVVVAMEEAAVERRLMLAGQAQGAQGLNPRRRLLPEMVAGIAAAIVFSVVPWGSGSRSVVTPVATAAVPAAMTRRPVDEPPDVHHALALLDARRDLFATVAGAGRQHAEF
jgi:hypothetical protein